MTAPAPIVFNWDGEAMTPLQPQLADRQYVVGERYRLAPWEDRSMASHNGYFAAISEAWQNLPDHLAERFATPDHLRRFALIKAGYRDECSFACSSKAEAVRLAAFIKPIDEYALVVVDGSLVIRYTAKSQSMKAMGKAEFQRSKDAVLEIVAGMIGNDAKTLERNADQAA